MILFHKIVLWSSAALLAATPTFAQKQVSILVQATASTDPTVNISMPIDGNYFEYNKVTGQLAANKEVVIKTPLNAAGVIKVANDFRSTYLLASPGDKYEVNFIPGKRTIEIKGNNAEGQKLYNLLFEDNTRSRFKDLDKYPLAAKRLQVCDSLKQVDLQKFKALLSAGKINTTFYKTVKIEADMYYKLLFTTNMFFSLKSYIYSTEIDEKNPVDPEFIKVWNSVYADVNKNKNWLKSQFYFKIMTRFSSLQQLRHKSLMDKTMPYALQIIHTFKPQLKGSALEYAWANGVVEGLGNNENEKVWLTNWAEFKNSFPKSKLIEPLTPGIKRVEAYHAAITNTSKEVEFLKDYAQINSLEELGQHLKGSVSYIDLWATWCGPCKLELQYSIKLHDDIKKLGVKPVYLSIDNDAANSKWQEMTKGFPLKGINLRANANLLKDIRAKVPNFVGIPRYLIFNAKGEVANWNAKRPSDMKDLLKQLSSF